MYLQVFKTFSPQVVNKIFDNAYVFGSRLIQTSSVRSIDQEWRKAKGLTINPNAFGPLTNRPDYSYADGKPTPLGIGQKERVLKHRHIAEKIVNLAKEVDFAVERHNQLQLKQEAYKKKILDDKLKPKGHLLLKK